MRKYKPGSLKLQYRIGNLLMLTILEEAICLQRAVVTRPGLIYVRAAMKTLPRWPPLINPICIFMTENEGGRASRPGNQNR